MKLKAWTIFFLLIIFNPVFAQQRASNTILELIINAKAYDGSAVVVRGEAIGQIMQRGNFAWVNIEDETGQIGVWVPWAETGIISHLGNYRFQGDTVEVEGIFFRADPQLPGETCVRSNKLVVVASGYPISRKINFVKIEISAILLCCVLLLWGIREFIRRRTRAGK